MNFAQIERYLVPALGFFIILAVTALYFAPHGQAHNFPTYLIGILVLITPAFWRDINIFWQNKSLLLAIVLLVYLAASTFWSPHWDRQEVISRFGDFALLVTFLAALSICYRHSERFFHWLFLAWIWVAVITAILSVYDHLTENGLGALIDLQPRLSGWGGRLDNEVVAAIAYATACQLALVRAMTEPRRIKAPFYWLAFIFLLAIVVLTQSRGPLLALLMGAVVLVLVRAGLLKGTLVIPALLITIAAGTVFLYIATTQEITPADYSEAELRERIVNDNPHLDLVSGDGMPAGIRSAYARPDTTPIRMAENGVMTLASDRDTSIGAVWPAFPVDTEAQYFISVRIKAAKETEAGFFLRVAEYDQPVMQATHVSPDARQHDESENDIVPATRRVGGLIEKWGLTTDWQTFVVEYNPTTSAAWASVVVLNWHQMGNAALDIDHLIVYELDNGRFDRLMNFNAWRPDVAGRLLTSSIDPRDLIWTRVIETALASRSLVGTGIAASDGITPRDGLTYDHGHSIFLSTLHYGGPVGLVLLLLLFLSLNRDIKRLPISRDATTAFGMIVFAMVVFAIDGDRLLTKINPLWIALWLPAGVLIALANEHYREAR